MLKKSVEDVDVKGKKILLRADFNVPLDQGKVRDDARIRAVLPTINYLLERGASLVLASHLGRPKGKAVPEVMMDPVAERLGKLLGKPVKKLGQVVGPEVAEAVAEMKSGDIILLENLRFDNREESNDREFARQLAEPVDLFANDAFGTAHRAHASTAGVAEFVPAVAGLLMKKEIEALSYCLENPQRPLTAILGGAKVSDKINVMRRFLQLADQLLIGGGMANTFLAARGFNLGDSFYEQDLLETASSIISESEQSGCRLILPDDLVVARELQPGSESKVVTPGNIDRGWKAADIGPETVKNFGRYISRSAMIVWNGPLGVFEVPPFDQGTRLVAGDMAKSEAYSVVGGGDLVAALESMGLTGQIGFISTGGGATLEFWEGKELPGIKVLQDK